MHYTNIFVLCMCFNIFNAVFCHTAPVPVLYLVLTSSLHLLMTQDSSNSTGNHPLTHTLSSSGTFRSSPPWSLNIYNKDNTVKNHYCLTVVMQLYKLYSINSTMYWQKHKNKKFRNKDSFSLIFPVIFRITFLVFWSLKKKIIFLHGAFQQHI